MGAGGQVGRVLNWGGVWGLGGVKYYRTITTIKGEVLDNIGYLMFGM